MTAEERIKNLEVDDTTATTFTDQVKVLGINRNNSTIAYKPYQYTFLTAVIRSTGQYT